MNLETLRRLVQWSNKISVSLHQFAQDLAHELDRAESRNDPLGLHIFQARASFRLTANRDNSKTGKRTELQLQTSYFQARTLGFRGNRAQWDELMRSGLSPHSATSSAACESQPFPD